MYAYKKDHLQAIKVWMSEEAFRSDAGMVEQIENVASLPFLGGPVCLMPDGHVGYGCPIGSVVATQGYVIPNLVGVDIGCGMTAIRTSYTGPISPDLLKQLMGVVRKVVPMGMGANNKEACSDTEMPQGAFYCESSFIEDAKYQLGTLGSGNHFIEFQKDERDGLWIMLHSGSRNLGKRICKIYNDKAEELCNLWKAKFPKELAWLPLESQEGEKYWMDMNYAIDFAFLNRQKMMYRIMEVTKNVFKKYGDLDIGYPGDMINIHHNYAAIEHHGNKNLVIHRKGATRVREGEIGIIPGSQGTASYIVRGRGNPESYHSCSHGAGRCLGRKDAQKKLDLKEEIKKLDDQGIIHGMRNQSDLDEAVGAYKPINEVMTNQADLVDILYKLRPIANLKG